MNHARTRRAYALPLVMLLALVGTIAATLIVEFQGNQRRAEEQSVEAYRAHHEQQGIAEVLELWLGLGRPQEIPPEGLAFQIRGPAGEIYQIELRDGQGTLLANPGTPSGDNGQAMGEAFARAAAMLGGMDAAHADPAREPLVRRHGPVRVNANSAPREVLVALARAVDPRAAAESFAAAGVERRDQAMIDDAGLRRLIADAGFRDREPADLLTGMLVTRSTLLEVDVAMRDPLRHMVARHRGLIQRSVVKNQPCAFLKWERVVETDSGQELGRPAARR